MIRIEQEDGWLLIRHQDHARMAGEIGARWGNGWFSRPEPADEVLIAVACHDDAWASRDAAPEIAPDGRPGAFSGELVGSYSAFENIDLEAYLRVRGAATEALVERSPLAAVIVSMHTVNLLTEQADLGSLSAGDRKLHAEFIRRQMARQEELKVQAGVPMSNVEYLRAFQFLQACDSCSLIMCVQYDKALPLRHTHPVKGSEPTQILCSPTGPMRYRLDPWPFADPHVSLPVPARKILGQRYESHAELRAAWEAGTDLKLQYELHR